VVHHLAWSLLAFDISKLFVFLLEHLELVSGLTPQLPVLKVISQTELIGASFGSITKKMTERNLFCHFFC